MSDSAPVVSSEPVGGGQTSTQTIAANVIEQAEAASTSSDSSEGYQAPGRLDTSNATETPVATQEELSEAAQFLVEHGQKWGKRPDGKTDLSYLPLSQVAKMLDKYTDQRKATWDGERGVFERQVKDAQTTMESFRRAVAGDPKAFLEELSGHDARYRSFLQPAQAAPAITAPSDRPNPDIDMGDGRWAYSREANEALIRWEAKQMLDERLKPFEERDKAAQAERVWETQQRALATTVQTQMQAAAAWPLFGALPADGSLTPFQTEVLAELQKDTEAARATGRRPSMTLREAYFEVKERHNAPEKVRERVVAELQQAAPRPDPALGRQASDAPRTSGPTSTADVVRRVIAQAERGGA